MCQTHLSRAAAIFAEVGLGTRLPLALSPELAPELRVHNDQGAAFLIEDIARLVPHNQFVVDASCCGITRWHKRLT